MGSSRLPGKVLKDIFPNKTILAVMLERLMKSQFVDEFIVATSNREEDLLIENECKKIGLSCFRGEGDENDVLGRFVQAAKAFNAQNIVRLCADSPLHDAEIMDLCIEKYLELKNQVDIVLNLKPETFPYGTAVEVFPFDVLLRMDRLSLDPNIREHVTQYFHRNPNLFKHYCVTNSIDLSQLRWVVDTQEDFESVKALYESIGEENITKNWREIVNEQIKGFAH